MVGNCPSRLAYLVAAGVISFLLTGVALAGLFLHIDAIKSVMPFICGFLALWWGITAGVASSPRTSGLNGINVGIVAVWLAFLAALAAAVGSAVEAGWISGDSGRSSAAVSDRDVEAGKVRAGSESTEGDLQDTVPVTVATPV